MLLWLEGEANEVKEATVVDALKFAQKHIVEIISVQEKLASSVNVDKLEEPEVL